MVIDMSPIDSQICHAGTCVSEIRKFMSNGLQNGMSETTRASVESGARMMGKSMSMQNARGITRNMLSCWSSCSELVMAPRAAAMLE